MNALRQDAVALDGSGIRARAESVVPPISPHPRVSVIIPTHNRSDMVGDAIQSVLDQTFQDYEVIVIDDGSEDMTAAFIRSPA